MPKGMKREAILLFPQVLIHRQGAGGGEGGPQGRAPQAPVGGVAAKPAAGGLPCGPQPGTLQKAGALSLWGGTGIFLSQRE